MCPLDSLQSRTGPVSRGSKPGLTGGRARNSYFREPPFARRRGDMTDHTSTPQASRSRGAATAANLSDVGAILRGLSVNMSERIQSLWTINLVTRALRLAAGPKDTCVI